jgi:hypothetical protein
MLVGRGPVGVEANFRVPIAILRKGMMQLADNVTEKLRTLSLGMEKRLGFDLPRWPVLAG